MILLSFNVLERFDPPCLGRAHPICSESMVLAGVGRFGELLLELRAVFKIGVSFSSDCHVREILELV